MTPIQFIQKLKMAEAFRIAWSSPGIPLPRSPAP